MNATKARRVWIAASKGVVDREWTDERLRQHRLAESAAVRAATLDGASIYGTTTSVGELDRRRVMTGPHNRFQLDLITNHAAAADSIDPLDDPLIGRIALAAKVEQSHRGGIGLPEAAYQRLLECLADEAFRPTIPTASSTYSCGDVVPGASLAMAVLEDLDDPQKLKLLEPSGGLALINGSHVQVAVSLDIARRLATLRHAASLSASLSLLANKVGRLECEAWIEVLRTSEADALKEYLATGPSDDWQVPSIQRPVSVRAIPSAIEALAIVQAQLLDSIEQGLRPSGNPLFTEIRDQWTAVSQATFLDVPLSLSVGAVTAAVLAVGWASERRLQHVVTQLSDQRSDDMLGLMQYAKVGTAVLERARATCSRRPFSAGGETANGVEDFWTFGVQEAHWARCAIDSVSRVLLRESAATAVLAAAIGLRPGELVGAGAHFGEDVYATESELVEISGIAEQQSEQDWLSWPLGPTRSEGP